MVLGAENGINPLVLDDVFLFVRVFGTGMAPIYSSLLTNFFIQFL